MTDVCTYPIITEKENVIESRQCGHKANIVFAKGEHTYPRCGKHGNPSVIAYAEQDGYTMRKLNVPTDPKERP